MTAPGSAARAVGGPLTATAAQSPTSRAPIRIVHTFMDHSSHIHGVGSTLQQPALVTGSLQAAQGVPAILLSGDARARDVLAHRPEAPLAWAVAPPGEGVPSSPRSGMLYMEAAGWAVKCAAGVSPWFSHSRSSRGR